MIALKLYHQMDQKIAGILKGPLTAVANSSLWISPAVNDGGLAAIGRNQRRT
jgi:hypothetical protein